MNVLDTDDKPVRFVPLVIEEGDESPSLTLRVPCVAGMFLAAAGVAHADVLARVAGSGDPFVDPASAPISLTEFDGQEVDFEFKVSAGAATSPLRVALRVRVTAEP